MYRVALAPIVLAAASFTACRADQGAMPPAAAESRVPPAAARSAVAPVSTPSGDVEFRAALDLAQTVDDREADLRGGRGAVSAEWPASLYATFTAHGTTAACTAALIGPSVMLTAAHCVPAAGSVTFTYVGHAKPYVATCTRHPDYAAPASDASADFALCSVAPAFAAPPGFRYETVSTADMSTMLQRTIVFTGFGCVTSVAAGAPFDGRYRIGFSTIEESSASPSRAHGEAFYAPNENNNLFTSAHAGATNLCAADSGGPVFTRTDDGPGVTARAIVGVTSRVFLHHGTHTAYGASMISATGSPAFHAWAGQWTRQTGAAACGIAGHLPDCRN
jgi:hypothetical protein